MITKYHMCVDIRDVLSWPDRYLKGMFTYSDGRRKSAAEVREFLYDCMEKGWKKFPIGKCEGFSYETGCPGHPQEKEAA